MPFPLTFLVGTPLSTDPLCLLGPNSLTLCNQRARNPRTETIFLLFDHVTEGIPAPFAQPTTNLPLFVQSAALCRNNLCSCHRFCAFPHRPATFYAGNDSGSISSRRPCRSLSTR